MPPKKAKYLQFQVIEKYVEDTFRVNDPYQSPCDTIYQKILDCYFKLEEDFITETQSYPNTGVNLTKSNISVKTIAQGELTTALIVEAKRFPSNRGLDWYKDVTKRYWTRPEGQLVEYMLNARDKDKWKHIMYGIVAIGDRVRFLQLQPNSETLEEYESEVLSGENYKASLSIRDDDILLEKVLREILRKVKDDRKKQRHRGSRP